MADVAVAELPPLAPAPASADAAQQQEPEQQQPAGAPPEHSLLPAEPAAVPAGAPDAEAQAAAAAAQAPGATATAAVAPDAAAPAGPAPAPAVEGAAVEVQRTPQNLTFNWIGNPEDEVGRSTSPCTAGAPHSCTPRRRASLRPRGTGATCQRRAAHAPPQPHTRALPAAPPLRAPAPPRAPGAPVVFKHARARAPPPTPKGDYQHYSSFQFCDQRYDVGDHVYLIPEDPGAPMYLARIVNAFEDARAEGSERLCIQVRAPARARARPRAAAAARRGAAARVGML